MEVEVVEGDVALRCVAVISWVMSTISTTVEVTAAVGIGSVLLRSVGGGGGGVSRVTLSVPGNSSTRISTIQAYCMIDKYKHAIERNRRICQV